MSDDTDARYGDGRSGEPLAQLRAIDPSAGDPGYWLRFHGRVMAGASERLAQRRMTADLTADLTVGDTVLSWSRTLVPTTMLAAAVAALFLVQGDVLVPGGADASIEELLVEGLESDPIPVAVASDTYSDDGGIYFTSEGY